MNVNVLLCVKLLLRLLKLAQTVNALLRQLHPHQIPSPGLTTATQSCGMTSVLTILAYCNTSTAIQASRYSPHEVLSLRHSPHAVLSLRHSSHAVLSLRHSSHSVLSLRHSPHSVLSLRHSPHADLSLRHSSNAVLSLRHSPHAVLSLRYSPLQVLPFRHQTVLCRCHAPGHAGLTLQLLSRPFYSLAPCRAVLNSRHPSVHFTHPGIRPMQAWQSAIRPCGSELPASVRALYTSWHKANAGMAVGHQAARL